MAQQIVDMEDAYDSSMKSVFMDQVVTEYVSARSSKIAEMFYFITSRVIEDSFGEYDSTIKKIPLKDEIPDTSWVGLPDYSCTTEAYSFNDIFSSNYYVVFTRVISFGGQAFMKEIWVRKVKEQAEVADWALLSKDQPYDDAFVFNISEQRDHGFMNANHRGSLYNYTKFHEFDFLIRSIYKEVKELSEK